LVGCGVEVLKRSHVVFIFEGWVSVHPKTPPRRTGSRARGWLVRVA
jgi:hypothetical protein